MSFLHRYRLVLLAVVGIALAVGAFLTLRDDTPSANAPAGALGPTPGPDSKGYVEAKRAYLTRIAKEDPSSSAAGLISFNAFRKTSEVKASVEGMDVSAVFVKFPSTDVEALQVKGTLDEAIIERADLFKKELTSELPELEKQMRDATGSARTDLAKLIEDQRKAITVVGPECNCLFAVSVESTTVKALADLGTRQEVRLVDVPEPVSATLRGWQLTPLVPTGT